MSLLGDSVTVELFINDTWEDISSYVRENPGITIGIGVASEGSIADPSHCMLTLNNPDGRFTPRNSGGPYYPYLTRNTPIRVTVGTTVRYRGYTSEFPVRADETATNVTVPIVANGSLRRLARSSVLDSTLKSAIVQYVKDDANMVGYWPCEDAPGSSSVASAIPGGPAGVITLGTPVFRAVDPGVMSKPIATWEAAGATFTPLPGSSTTFTCGALVSFPDAGVLTGGEELFRCYVDGTANIWSIAYSPNDGGGLVLTVIANDLLGTELYGDTVISGGLDGTNCYVKLEANQNGADVDFFVDCLPGPQSGVLTVNSCTVGAPYRGQIGMGILDLPDQVGIGHFVLGKSNTVLLHSDTFDPALEGYAGETVTARMARLSDQGGIDIQVVAGPYSPTEIGAQSDGSLLDALREAEKADAGGILYDSPDDSGLVYICRTARYNDQQPSFALDYEQGHLTPPLSPTDDDQQIRNDVTVNRANGSSARITLDNGALSTADYPDGVGPYRFEDTYATYEDSQLPYLAGWVLGHGTVDETRWPQITVDLVKNPGLVSTFDTLRPGSVVTVANLPDVYGVTDVTLQCIGWEETITAARRTVTLNCVPGTPWQMVELNDTTFGELDVMRLAL
jgi:hypothetical protein